MIADKVEKVLRMSDCNRCVVSKSKGTMIDVLHPNTGLTFFYGKTVEECRNKYPEAEEMGVEEFCQWKASQQRTQITWEETTEARFYEMLNVLPPALWESGGFLVGEPYDHDYGNGQPRYSAYRLKNGRYETGSRPMTKAEYRKEMAA
jgi:hypothetical protein